MQGDYLIPSLAVTTESEKPIGIWGQRHLGCLKQHHKVLYYNLLTSGKVTDYISEIDKQAEDMFFRLIKQTTDREGVSEQLKADNPMQWVGRINNIRNRAMKIVNNEIIYTV